MEYNQNIVQSFNIFGTEVRQNPCIILAAAPTKETQGVVGLLAVDLSSEKKDLYKCIAVENGSYIWNEVGSSSTEVVDTLPSVEDGDEDIDYIVNEDGIYLYYKFINGKYELIAGSVAEIINELPDNGNTHTDYYKPNIVDGKIVSYFHYRWNENEKDFIMIGSDAYSKEEINGLLEQSKKELQDNIDKVDEKATKNATEIGNRTSDKEGSLFKRVEDLEFSLENFKGDNEELKVTYQEDGSILYLHTGDEVAEDASNVISSTIITGGGGGAGTASYKIVLTSKDTSDNIVSLKGEDIFINYEVTLTAIEDNTPVTDKFTLYLYINDKLQETFYNKITGIDSLNITPYLSSSTAKNSIRLTAAYSETLEDSGTVVTIRSSKRWYIEIVDMYIEPGNIDFDKTVKTTSPVRYYYTPYGNNLSKTIYYKLDGEINQLETPITTSGVQQYIDLPITQHGAHSFEIWCEATINGVLKSSDRFYYDIMFAEEGNKEPIIRALIDSKAILKQYYTIPFYYSVYSPTEETVNLIVNKDGISSIKNNIDRTEQEDFFTSEDSGEKVITISCNWDDNDEIKTVTKTLTLNIAQSDYEIDPPVTGGLAFDFNPKDRSNNDIDYDVFYDVNGQAVPDGWTFSPNFDWINGGWKSNEEDGFYFCVKAGNWVDFNYKLFNDSQVLIGENNTKGNGKEFKIIFKTTNVANNNAQWLNCTSDSTYGNLTGVQMNVHKGYIHFNGNNLTIPYSEDDIIEFDMNIVPITLKDGAIDNSIKDIPMIMTYEDGTPVQPFVIESTNTSLKQDKAVPIRIGSPDCDVYIYRMKAYSRFLSEQEIIQNFIADARSGIEKNNRYIRNQIFEQGTINITPESVAEACPELRVIKISAPRFTYDKSDKVPNTEIEMIYKNGDDTQNWVAKNCQHSGQGTSSNDYGYSGRNLDLIMNKSGIEGQKPIITFRNNTSPEDGKIQLTKTSVPTNYLNIKVNIASSEHSNNALLQKRYDRYLPYKSLAEDRYKDTEYDVKNTMEFYNCVVFIRETEGEETGDYSSHQEFADWGWHFYSLGNIGDSKKTDDTRVVDPEDDNEFCNEILDWNLPLANFPLDTFVNIMTEIDDNGEIKRPFLEIAENLFAEGKQSEIYELSDGEYVPTTDSVLDTENNTYYIDALKYDDYSGNFTYEFRYLKDEDKDKDKAKSVWINFYKFVIQDIWSRDAQGNIIQEELEDGTFKDKIDENKRILWKSKLKEWFIEEAALYYYIFTLRYTMVDNRAKNSFWHYAKTGTIRTVSEPVPEMLHVYYDKVNQTDINSKLMKNLNGEEGYYRKTSDTSIIAEKTYYTEYAFDFWDYDNDTALGIDNAGKLEMDYGIEEEDRDASNSPYFRAHDSTFFVNLSKVFENELANFYSSLNISTFDAVHLINEFDTWQQQFPEQLWRIDYETKYKRTYVGGYGNDWDNRRNPAEIGRAAEPRFLRDMMNGRKKYQRRQFEREQEKYMISKFDNSSMTSDRMTLRGSNKDTSAEPPIVIPKPELTFDVTAYAKTYLNIYYNVSSRFIHKRLNAGDKITVEYPQKNIDFIYINNASRIASLGDLSLLYLQEASFGPGRKLREIILGNDNPVYDNTSLSGLSITRDNSLLEELNITNLSTIKELPALEVLPSLRKLYAEGTSLTNATFANNGVIEEAYLPSTVTQLTLQNLYYLTTLTCTNEEGKEDYSKIIKLVIDNCPNINSLHIVSNTSNKLNEIKITNIDWVLDDTSLLNRLVKLKGISGDNSKPILTGKVTINGQIKTTELAEYRKIWSEEELQLIYDPAQVITYSVVKYVNPYATEENKEIFSIEVRNGDFPPDPFSIDDIYITEENVLVNFPLRESDEQYNYIFGERSDGNYIKGSGWQGKLGAPITEETIIEAYFSKIIRTYTVRWFSDKGESPLDEKIVLYGEEAIYSKNLPTKISQNNIHYLFSGWDKSSGCIRGNTDIYAKWLSANLPTPYDEFSQKGTKLENMTVEQINAIISTQNITIKDNYFYSGDYTDITLGHDFDFEPANSNNVLPGEVKSETIVQTNEEKIFNYRLAENYPETDANNGQRIEDTNVIVFDENSDSFTLVIDFRFLTSNDERILACVSDENGSTIPIKLYYSGGPRISCNGVSQSFGSARYRDIVVIRYSKIENIIKVYASNISSKFSTTILNTTLISDFSKPNNKLKLYLGGAPNGKMINDEQLDGTNKSNAIIYWCKFWKDDLGDTICKQLVQWPREKLRMQYFNANEYNISNTENFAKASFYCKHLLDDRTISMNETPGYGGWKDSDIYKNLMPRLYNAFPVSWNLLIKQVNIPSNVAMNNSESNIISQPSYIYIPSVTAITPSGEYGDPKLYEENILEFVTKRVRILRYQGFLSSTFLETENPTYSDNSDPREYWSDDEEAQNGTLWAQGGINNNNYPNYYYLSEYDRIKNYFEQDTSDGKILKGKWIPISTYWTRSSVTNNSNFYLKNKTAVSISYPSNTSAGIWPCFSI